MAHTAISDPEMMKERFDEPEVLAGKIEELVGWMREAQSTVISTGAGISTSCGIPDFRSPNGVWTLKAQGRRRKGPTTPTTKAVPSLTHMGILALLRSGHVAKLMSQNCDGLHRRSGVAPDQIAELHGNSNLEYCIECGAQYLRDFACRRITRSRDHYTGRHCSVAGCGGRLWDSTIDFGQNLPEAALSAAYQASDNADLHIVFGSSLTVSPACDMPRLTKTNGGRLVIVNIQRTPLTDDADLHIHARTDDVMRGILAGLGLDAPRWLLRRSLRIIHGYVPVAARYVVSVDAVDPDDDSLPATVLTAVHAELGSASGQTVADPYKGQHPKSVCLPCPADPVQGVEAPKGPLTLTLGWVGHYAEPNMRITLAPQSRPPATPIRIDLAYDVTTRAWTVTSRSDSPPADNNEPASSSSSSSSPSSSVAAAAAAATAGAASDAGSESGSGPRTRLALGSDTAPAYLASPTRMASLPDASKPDPLMWAAAVPVTPRVAGETAGPGAVLCVGGLAPRGARSRSRPRISLYQVVEQTSDGTPAAVWFAPEAGNLDIKVTGYGSSSRAMARGASVLSRWLVSAAPLVSDPSSAVVFGGCDSQAMYNDVHLLRTETRLDGPLPITVAHVSPLRLAQGTKPPAHRLGASLTALPDGRMVLFGGSVCESGPYTFLNDVHVLDVGSRTWSRIETSAEADPPAPRAQHAAVYLPDAHAVLVVGGLTHDRILADAQILDLATWTWTPVAAAAAGGPADVHLDGQAPFKITPASPIVSLVGESQVLVWGIPRQEAAGYLLDLAAGSSGPSWRGVPAAGLSPGLPATGAASASLPLPGTDYTTATFAFGGITARGERVTSCGPMVLRA